MLDPKTVLSRYWGYSQFRSLQQEIVQSVLDGHDTLALLPTGGGKSICFQVPAICLEQTCLVISPLIALMKDQVENLIKRGISAGMISSVMKAPEIGLLLEKCRVGNIQFLYVSPERLLNQQFIDELPQLGIGLIAVDEAHCISQWGYDFRPSYLQIAEIRVHLPKVPVIALTATATPEVCDDIELQLQFQNKQRFKKSFTRSNLAYIIRKEEDKLNQLVRILTRIEGSSVVYVRNRKRCHEVSDFLVKQGFSSSYYHAGLDSATRSIRQEYWIDGRIKIIVCTNAFGMGIDKANVRTVLHLELPDSIEAYFQEAGRAGRDGEKAWAVLIVDDADKDAFQLRFEQQFPGFDIMKAVYNSIGNFLQLPVGAGEGVSFPFDLSEFSKRYKLHPVIALQSIRFMEREGLLSFQENINSFSRLFFTVSKEQLYEFEFRNQPYEPLIKTILRSYGGTFQDYVQINEKDLAARLGISEKNLINGLLFLDKSEILSYIQRSDQPQLYFTSPRQHPDRLPFSKRKYDERLKAARNRMDRMLDYSTNDRLCRSKQLVSYFGEKDSARCGQCDVCIEQSKNGIVDAEFDRIQFRLLSLLEQGKWNAEMLLQQLPHPPEKVLNIIRTLLDESVLKESAEGLIELN
jgi:ATP-dependent DNA helicase RecQ